MLRGLMGMMLVDVASAASDRSLKKTLGWSPGLGRVEREVMVGEGSWLWNSTSPVSPTWPLSRGNMGKTTRFPHL